METVHRERVMVASSGCSLASVWVTSGAPPAMGKAPTGAVNSGEALGAVGLAWVMVYWHELGLGFEELQETQNW
jgi:hypothetical protein